MVCPAVSGIGGSFHSGFNRLIFAWTNPSPIATEQRLTVTEVDPDFGERVVETAVVPWNVSRYITKRRYDVPGNQYKIKVEVLCKNCEPSTIEESGLVTIP